VNLSDVSPTRCVREPTLSRDVKPFRINEAELPGGVSELRIEGELDLAVADQLERALGRVGEGPVLIDLGPCEFIDSTGIAVVVRAHRRLTSSGGYVAVHSAKAQVLRVLTMTGFTANGLVFDSRKQALSALRPAGS
jgi:anti-sigma B factor antagonist